jgi:2-polyprenyl-3-methyl-5-hydroxy-6-metoxy-1,4-benzoquinol methylase
VIPTEAEVFEKSYWGDCLNTFDEEQKHFVYARLMGIPVNHWRFDARGKSVLDIGGGPVSMLLKAANKGNNCAVLDPLQLPYWVIRRYTTAGISCITLRAEDWLRDRGQSSLFDEVWIYNCLQHVVNPEKILSGVRALPGKPSVRIFEWVNIPAHEGHPHELTKEKLDGWLGVDGKVTQLDGEMGCSGQAYSWHRQQV